MTLSRMHLPSISSVFTSNCVFLPGHSAVTKMDMEVPEPILLPVPDHLMKTIRSDEGAPFGYQASSFEIGPKPDTVIEEDKSATTGESPSTPHGRPSRSSTPSKSLKHDRGPLAFSLRVLSPIKLVRSFSRRSGSKGRAFSSS